MKVTIRGTTYDCRKATAEEGKVTLYLGQYDEDGSELVSVFYGFPPEDITAEGGTIETTASTDDVLNALLGVTE